MIDTHCHILPGLDDGPRTMEGAMRMAETAVKQGIHTIIATPHHGTRRYSNTSSQIQNSVKLLNQELRRRKMPLQVLPGQEYRLSEFYKVDYEAGRLQTMADSSYLLVELPSRVVPTIFPEFIRYMRRQGIIVVIAHPERNLGVIRKPNRLLDWMHMGVLIQVTSQSLIGLFGKKIQRIATLICKRQWVHLLASDAHNTLHRSFHLREGYAMIDQLCESAFVDRIKSHAQELVVSRK